MEEYTVGDDVILVIKVPRASRSERPIYLNNDVFGSTFRRDHEGDYHCTESEIKAMIRDSSTETEDMHILENRRIEDFSKESVKSYRIRYNTRHEGSSWTQLPDSDFLVRIGAASDETGEIRPTVAGLLMFGQEYIITREFPEYFLDYRERLDPTVRWTDRVQSQSGDWSGNVFDFFNLVYPKVTADFKKPFMTDGPYRIEESPMHLAVREAIANCLVNTDYYQKWGTVIERYPDKIILSNPGLIRLGKAQMLKGGISEPRNQTMLKIFNLIGIGDRAGSGVPDIFETWRKEKLEIPTVSEQFGEGRPDRTILTLPLRKNDEDRITGENNSGSLSHSAVETDISVKQLNDILEYCNVPRSRAEIQEYCGYKSVPHFRGKIFKSSSCGRSINSHDTR